MHRIVSFLLAASAALGADAIYINANVITVDPSKPYAEAFAVTNGRFSAVGRTGETRRLATPATKIVDLKGMTVTPGFNDAHLQPTGAKAAKTPPGQMVTGTRYQDTKLGRHP